MARGGDGFCCYRFVLLNVFASFDRVFQVIENLESLTNLTHLYIGKNKIKKIENLDKLENLELISLQANRIVKLENLDKLVNLTDLYVSENGIEQIEGLENNKLIETIDVAKNRLTIIDNVSHLENLQEFWVCIMKRGNISHFVIHILCRISIIRIVFFFFCFKHRPTQTKSPIGSASTICDATSGWRPSIWSIIH